MNLHFQDPENNSATSLHEQILENCVGAERGAAMFAFATSKGIKLLLEDSSFISFLETSQFDLVVGIDQITNVAALTTLREIALRHENLKPRAFLHTRSTLFHPKCCFFEKRGAAQVLVGSGNLTPSGLRGNWEAFGSARLEGESVVKLRRQWNDWCNLHSLRLKAIDSEEVLQRAAKNIFVRRPRDGASGREQSGSRGTPEVARPDVSEASQREAIVGKRALVAEIPRAGSRWNQANFDVNTFTNFFGAIPDGRHRIVLQHVNEDGSLGSFENRPAVTVMSRNFRFELDAAAGLPYPDDSRPIVVFVEIGLRTFRYRLLMPDDADYGAINRFVAARRVGQIARIVTSTDALLQVVPNSPLWKQPLEVTDDLD